MIPDDQATQGNTAAELQALDSDNSDPSGASWLALIATLALYRRLLAGIPPAAAANGPWPCWSGRSRYC
jgi:hypothetical protein